MNRTENSDSIPMDLILQILSRLPSKSVGRFHCVSKLWRSMLSGPYFTELYLTRSSARPRLLFAVVYGVSEELRFYSSPQPQISHDKSALVVTADFHTTFPSQHCNYASGLICFRGKGRSGEKAMTPICNPITGQYVELPKVIMYFTANTFIGFDPVEKQFKVLITHYPYNSPCYRDKILTLGAPKLGWRDIICPKYYRAWSEPICINGVIYYVGHEEGIGRMVVVCFDVRYEEFKLIKAECFNQYQNPTLVNYKGKLGGINWEYGESGAIELHMWVLHDVEKQEWSKYVYPLPENDIIKPYKFLIAGMTITGEFVLSMIDTSTPFYVFYFNHEKNTLRRVEIQGFGENLTKVYKVFVDHVEDFNFFFKKKESLASWL